LGKEFIESSNPDKNVEKPSYSLKFSGKSPHRFKKSFKSSYSCKGSIKSPNCSKGPLKSSIIPHFPGKHIGNGIMET
jgi:hypothetical protein